MEQESNIVISSKEGRLGNPEEPGTKLIMFNMEGDRIVGVREEISTGKDMRAWFSLRGINRLYVSAISPFLRQALTGLGITVKQSGEVENDRFYNRFIFD